MTKYVALVLLGCALSGPLFVGCSLDAPASSEQKEVGNLSLSLIGQTGSNTYRLRNALFDIAGPTATQLDSEGDPNATALQATLAVGNYSITLASGWVLQRLDAGSYVAVEATLVSANPGSFEILPNGTTRQTFRFSTNGEIVDIGTGTLLVDIAVDESGIGSTCYVPDQSSCPTGLACYYDYDATDQGTCLSPGDVPFGGDCTFGTPGQCVPNGVCGFGGSGPTGAICMEVCDLAAPVCSSGTCLDQGVGFGLCL